jgi:hypothetical protein
MKTTKEIAENAVGGHSKGNDTRLAIEELISQR